MQCPDCREQFSAILDGEATPLAQAKLEEHLAACAPCRAGLNDFREAVRALQSTDVISAGPEFAERVTGTITRNLERAALLEPAASAPLEAAEPAPAAPGAPTLATPRASVLPRAPGFRWAAAAVLAAVLGGALYMRDLIQELNRGIQELRASAGHPPAVTPPPSGDVVLYQGRAWTVKELAAHLGLKDRPFSGDELNLVVEQFLRQEGFEKVNDLWVRRDEIGLYGDGKIQVAPGEWVDAEAFVRRFHEGRGHVDVAGGGFVTRGYLEKTGGTMPVVDPGTLAADAHPAARALARLHLGAGTPRGSLTLYPLRAPRQIDPAGLITLHRAGGDVAPLETGNPFTLQIANRGSDDVLLIAGDLLLGGAYDRVLAESAILPSGGKPQTLRVYSAESGAFRSSPAFDERSGHELAPLLVRKALGSDLGQAAVWAAGYEYARLAGARSVGLAALYATPTLESLWVPYDTAFWELPGDEEAVGVVIGVGDEVVCAEWFGSNRLLRENFDRILRAAALEAIRREERGAYWNSTYPNSLDGARAFLENVVRAEVPPVKSSGTYPLAFGSHALGSVTILVEGEDPKFPRHVLHALVFDPTMEAVAAARKWARYETDPRQAEQFLRALERQMKEAAKPEDRLALFRQLAALPPSMPGTVRLWSTTLSGGTPDLQAEAIAALRQSPDPEAVTALMSFFDASAASGSALLEPAAEALMASRSEAATVWMINSLARATPEAAKALLPRIPKALYATRAGDEALALETVRKIGAFWEGPSAQADLAPLISETLERLTKEKFQSRQDLDFWMQHSDKRDFKMMWTGTKK